MLPQEVAEVQVTIASIYAHTLWLYGINIIFHNLIIMDQHFIIQAYLIIEDQPFILCISVLTHSASSYYVYTMFVCTAHVALL